MMKKLFIAALSLLPLSGYAADSFCVQTFNAHATVTSSNNRGRLKLLADSMAKDEACAAYHFQEIWMEGDFSYFSSLLQPQRLNILFSDDLRHDGDRTGLSSAYPGKIISARSSLYRANSQEALPTDIFGVEKGFILADVKLTEGPEILFWNTHTNPRNGLARIAQAVQTADEMLTQEAHFLEFPFVLTGDLNDYPDSPELAILQNVLLLGDSFWDANGSYNGICTFCSEKEILDFVLYRSAPTMELKVMASAVNLKGDRENSISDHYGVRSSFRFTARAANLLPENDSLVARRKQAAVTALQGAQAKLSASGDSNYKEMGARAAALAVMIRDGNLPAASRDLYRLR